MKLVIRDIARIDLRDIYRYSAQCFGKNKAKHYAKEIEQRIYQIRDNPKLGKNLDYIKPNLRSIIALKHSIYYLIKPTQLIILRVLHQSRDAGRHL